MAEIKGVSCYNYFHGIDGLGTCDDGCQWLVRVFPCPYWYETEAEWDKVNGMLHQMGEK